MSAVLSPCGLYRYRLDRLIGPGPAAAIIMVNPSTADAVEDDATIRKVVGFAERNGIGRVIVGNKFAFRATDVRALKTAQDPRGPANDHYLEQMLQEADVHIVAWGPLAKLPRSLHGRWRRVVAIADRLGFTLQCLGTVHSGHPRHPLMTPYATPLTPWERPA